MSIDSKNVTKKHLIDSIADKSGIKRGDVKRVVQGLLDQIIQELAEGKRLELRDFGVFEIKERSARTAQNPKTLQPVDVPPKRAVKFKGGRRMRDAQPASAAMSSATRWMSASASFRFVS